MKIPCNLTISRNSRDVITLRVRDNISHNVVCEAEMQLAEFAQLMTGLSEVEAMAEWHNTEFIGMKKITERRSRECPIDEYDRDKLRTWLSENGKEDGWFIDTYLGSQGSIGRRGDKVLLNYSVYRYEKVTPTNPPSGGLEGK